MAVTVFAGSPVRYGAHSAYYEGLPLAAPVFLAISAAHRDVAVDFAKRQGVLISTSSIISFSVARAMRYAVLLSLAKREAIEINATRGFLGVSPAYRHAVALALAKRDAVEISATRKFVEFGK